MRGMISSCSVLAAKMGRRRAARPRHDGSARRSKPALRGHIKDEPALHTMTKRKSVISSRPAIIPAPESRVDAFERGARRPERSVMSRRILSILLLAACVDPAESELAETNQEIANPVSVAPNQLLGVVRVSGTQGSCSGTLIARPRLLGGRRPHRSTGARRRGQT